MAIKKTITVPKAKSVSTKHPVNFGVLGKEIKISPKAQIWQNSPGLKIEYFVPTIDIVIGIGRDHTATLIMDEDAWKALNKKGNPINITTLQDFKKSYITPKNTKTK